MSLFQQLHLGLESSSLAVTNKRQELGQIFHVSHLHCGFLFNTERQMDTLIVLESITKKIDPCQIVKADMQSKQI